MKFFKSVLLLMFVTGQTAFAAEVFRCTGNTDTGPATARVSINPNKGWFNSVIVQYANSFFTQVTRGEYSAYYDQTSKQMVGTGIIADIDSRMTLTFPTTGPTVLTIFAGGDKGDRRIEFGSGAHLTCNSVD
jgi:hypothetical protein